MKVKEIAFACYPVNDMARARKFYEEVFGLNPSTSFGEDTDDSQWVEYLVGDSAFSLGKHKDWKPSRDGVSIALEVEDLDEIVKRLKELNMEFKTEKIDFPGCSMASVYDTEGNVLVIHKRK